MTGHSGDGFLHYNIRLMRTIGLWPLATDSRPLLLLNSLYTALLVVSLAVVSVCQVIEIFVSPNITSMASAVDLATLTSSALFKMVYIISYRKHFQRLVDKINNTFVEKDFFLGNFSMTNWLKHSKLYIAFYVSMGAPTVFVIGGLPPYFIPQYFKRYQINEKDGENFNFSNKERMFPLSCWFPFDVTWSPLYETVYVFELLSLCAAGQLYMVSDSFFFMIIYLICGQLELLKTSYRGLQENLAAMKMGHSFAEESFGNYNNLRSVSSPSLWQAVSKNEGIQTNVNEYLKMCIDLHSTILEIINELDTLLRSMVLVDFIHAVVSLSFATLEIFISNTYLEWFQMCVFIAVCIIHQFLNNYFGEILSQQQISVAAVVYETPWVDSTDLHKVAIYMTLNQANHPTRLSGWRMYHLGLGTFVEFMKLLGSYVLVLQSLRINEDR